MYSADSSSKSEYGRTKASRSLDKCAYILNEVLDNGPAILEAVKKRKCISSPRTEQRKAPPSMKRVKQTNRCLNKENANYPRSKPTITASTPSSTVTSGIRRRRSASASSVALSSSIRNQYRSRCLGQRSRTRSLSANRTRSRIAAAVERTASHVPVYLSDASSAISRLGNASSVSSEADTLTGIHMDNSSLFGVPPVFAKQQSRRVKARESRTASRKSAYKTAGWLKPQASITTQTTTPVEDKAMPPCQGKEPIGVDKKNIRSSLDGSVTVGVATDVSERGGKTQSEQQKRQHGTRTPTKLEQPHLSSLSSQDDQPQLKESAGVLQLLYSLKEILSNKSDSGEGEQLIEVLTSTVAEMVRERRSQQLTVRQLLLPFQKESRLLKAEVQTLKSRLNELNKADGSHQQLDSIGHYEKLVSRLSDELEVERLRCRRLEGDVLHYRQLPESMTRPSVDNLNNSYTSAILNNPEYKNLPAPHSDSVSSDHQLIALKHTLRLIRNKLVHLTNNDMRDVNTSGELHNLLELCSQQTVYGINDVATVSKSQQLNSNHGDFGARWGQSKLDSENCGDAIPSHIIHTVSRNISKVREAEVDKIRVSTRHDPQSDDLPLASSSARLQLHTSPIRCHTSPLLRHTSSPVEQHNSVHTSYPISTADRHVNTYCDKAYLPPTKYSSLSSSPPERDSAVTHTASSSKALSGVTSEKTSAQTLSLGFQRNNSHHNDDDDDTLTTYSNTLLDVCDYSDTSLATTTADSMFQQGLAQLDANIARLEESLRGVTTDNAI